MKKLMFTLAICSLVITSAQAQKQLGGEHNVEVNLTPFGNSPVDGTTIKYRNFLDDDKSVPCVTHCRFYFWNICLLPRRTNALVIHESTVKYGNSNSLIGIAPGYEIHFSGTDNLSPYFGIEAYYMMGSRTDLIESWGPNDLDNVGQPDVYVTWDLTNKQAYSSMGLNLLFGADYYFSDAIYVGFEAGLGFGTTSFGNHEIGTSDLTAFNIQFNGAFDPTTAGAAIADTFVGELPFNVLEGDIFYDYYEQGYTYPNQVSNTSLGNVFNGAIRVGFLFD